jgi:hypothetical protein
MKNSEFAGRLALAKRYCRRSTGADRLQMREE